MAKSRSRSKDQCGPRTTRLTRTDRAASSEAPRRSELRDETGRSQREESACSESGGPRTTRITRTNRAAISKVPRRSKRSEHSDEIGRLLLREESVCSESGNDSANTEQDVEFGVVDPASGEDQGDDIIGSNNSDYGEFITVDDDTDESQDGDIQQETSSRGIDDSLDSGMYVSNLTTASGLHIAERARAEKAFQDHGEVGLFSLFITQEFKTRIQKWTNLGLKSQGHAETTESEFDAYVGLELAMSICPLNEITEFWSEKRFIGHRDFSVTMSRNRFQAIRGRLKLHPPDLTTGNGKDPLWHSRILMEHVQAKFAQIAIPYGASSLDECSVRTKARTRAKSFMPSKPDKYAIRFYAVVGWKSLYVHSIWDNGSGNRTRISPAARYTKVFPGLFAPLDRTLSNPDIGVDKKSASALWVAMMGHQASLLESPSGRRLMVTDNFYTRHALAKALLTFTDGETRLIGTIRENNVEKTSKLTIAASMVRVEEAPRGSWELIAILEQEAGYAQRKREHVKSQRNIAKNKRTSFPPPVKVFAPNAGYIVFKDRKIVLFYTNDLRKTPPKLVMAMDNPDAIDCVHGLSPVKRWTGNENLHKKTFMVPAVIAAYNAAMNGVDRVDQLRSTNPTRRKEMRLSMSIFTWALDMCVINAYALFREVMPENSTVRLREFKRRIAEQLTSKQLACMSLRKATKRKVQDTRLVLGESLSGHILTPNSTVESDGQLKCLLCRMRGFQKRSRWGCAVCQVGFHVECFAVFHFRDAFEHDSTPSVREALDLVCASATGNGQFKTRTKKNKSITPLPMIRLPSQSHRQCRNGAEATRDVSS